MYNYENNIEKYFSEKKNTHLLIIFMMKLIIMII